ncbi:hypothetical protein [Aeromicrobium sp. UC242_57]|uniref:hypothetical protein n=1 Tax=Aeromicrobium sp. UC242_57 TaxID=3374624 RepID=UPI0037B5F071
MTAETVPLAPGFAAIAERIDLEPLTASTVGDLLRARFDAEPHDILVRFLHERSNGGYASLCQLADALAESGAITSVEDTLILKPSRLEQFRQALPERRSSSAASRLGGTPGIIDLLDLVSVIGEVELDEAVTCSSPADVALAVLHGTLREVDGAVTMTDPVDAECLVAGLSAARMVELSGEVRTLHPTLSAEDGERDQGCPVVPGERLTDPG